MSAPDIPPDVRRLLDELPVSRIVEYVCGRFQLEDGEKALLLFFKNGRYDRLQPFDVLKPGYPSRGV